MLAGSAISSSVDVEIACAVHLSLVSSTPYLVLIFRILPPMPDALCSYQCAAIWVALVSWCLWFECTIFIFSLT